MAARLYLDICMVSAVGYSSVGLQDPEMREVGYGLE